MARPPAQRVPFHEKLGEQWRNRLADVDALPQLTLLGIVVGAVAAGVIVAFRLLVEGSLAAALPEHRANFEALPGPVRFLLPLAGAALIAGLLALFAPRHRDTGVTHVLDRLHNHQGRLPLRNALAQFGAGALALISGHSAGREGPAVHLGAAGASKLGQVLGLPNNSLRPLVACGVSAAIAASFNTPMAGVIFAMEVVLLEYTIAGFIPVILAAVIGSLLTQLVFGPDIVFAGSQQLTGQLTELPAMAVLGLLVGLASALYLRLHTGCAARSASWPLWLRLLLAGLVGGLGGLLVPQVMGMGFDTINGALTGQIAATTLALILAAKLLVTAAVLGLGIPGGVIGATLVMGACLGGAAGYLAAGLPIAVSEPGVYAIVGMSAMMAAVINAPLAAIIAILELTYNPGILMPGMLVVVIACLTTRWLLKTDGLFSTLLEQQGKRNRPELMQQLLSRTGVRSIMRRNFCLTVRRLSPAQATAILKQQPEWLVLANPTLLIEPAALASALESHNAEQAGTETELDLLAIPARRLETVDISPDANLYEAWLAVNRARVDALSVRTPSGAIVGLVTRDQLESHYRL